MSKSLVSARQLKALVQNQHLKMWGDCSVSKTLATHNHEALSRISKHPCTKLCAVAILMNPTLGRLRQTDPWSSLARQPSQVRKLTFPPETPCFKDNGSEGITPKVGFTERGVEELPRNHSMRQRIWRPEAKGSPRGGWPPVANIKEGQQIWTPWKTDGN